MEEERSALFDQVRGFSQGKLKKVETKVLTGTGEQLVEERNALGVKVKSGVDSSNEKTKPDLQVGLIVPGLLIGSKDVSHDKSSIESYGITHILNLDAAVKNKFEDDYNYKNVDIQDRPDFELEKVFRDCFDFIDEGRHYGNVLVHCGETIGLSKTTSICAAYLMDKEKKKLDEALAIVKEARSFVKPSEAFMKQLKDYEIKLLGVQMAKSSGIDDPFALKKKQEIEAEKAMLAGAGSVKNRMAMFGNMNANANLNPPPVPRSKSASPTPFKNQPIR